MAKLLVGIFFIIILLNNCFAGKELRVPGGTVCRDTNGDQVDWWILLKSAGPTGTYILFTSKDAKEKKTISLKLSDRYIITDVTTSPILRTVYDSFQSIEGDKSPGLDNRMFMAWNDQQPRPGTDTGEAPAGEADDFPEDETLLGKTKSKQGHSRDMYGQVESTESAHSKGIMGFSVVDDEGFLPKNLSNEKQYRVQGFLIQHSFPRTPNAIYSDHHGAVKRTKLPDPDKFFGSNILAPQSKAQHAMCISYEQNVEVIDGEIVFDRDALNRKTMNFFSLLDGLDVIGPSMTMTNYVPWLEEFRIYHQIFDVRNKWSPNKINLDEEEMRNGNVARIIPRNHRIPLPDYSDHLFPLWPSRWRLSPIYEENPGFNGIAGQTWVKRDSATSLRSPGQTYATRCKAWSPVVGERSDPGCFSSTTLTSTSNQYPIILRMAFKNGFYISDIDDIIGAHAVPQKDYKMAMENDGRQSKDRDGKRGGLIQPRYVALLIVVQSWFDSGTMGACSRYLVKTDTLKVVAWYLNNNSSVFPKESGGVDRQPSIGTNHSKWFITYLLGQKGQYVPLCGFMDLNRNEKATKLPNRDHGRGGMFIFMDDPLIASFMMNLVPIVAYRAARTLLPIDLIHKLMGDQ